MAKRSRRPPYTVDAESGEGLGIWYDPRTWGDSSAYDWQPSPKYPEMDFVIVPNDTPMPMQGNDAVAAWVIDSPAPGKTTWYRVTQRSYDAGQRQAVIDTVVATAQSTGEAMAKVGTNVINAVDTITSNIVPILIGLAALFIFMQSSKGGHYDE